MAALTTTTGLKQEKSEEDDMISRLPEALLQHMLSFLPTEDAVRTSILSKTWEYLWTTIPNLTFELYSEEDMDFVDRALLLRGSTTVKMFDLACDMEELDELGLELALERWFNALVKLNVEKLCLCFMFDGYNSQDSVKFNLPCCLCVCASLTSLTLNLNCYFTCPSSVHLSSLKRLVLESVYFGDAESVENLFTGCPLLETASLIDCEFRYSLRISAPNLCKLKISDPRPLLYEPQVDEVMIFAPSLKAFYLKSNFASAYSLHDVPSLDEAKILIGKNHWEVDEDYVTYLSCLNMVLEGISQVKKLCLSCEAIKALKNLGNFQPQVPFFNNLSVLSVRSRYGSRHGSRYGSRFGRGIELGVDYTRLTEILQKSHHLETLRFEDIIIREDCKEYERILNPVPPCFLSSLKTLELLFNNRYNNRYQKLFMNAAKVLLERAVVLEKLILYASGPVEVEKDKLIKALNKLPRTSKLCQIEFADSEWKFL